MRGVLCLTMVLALASAAGARATRAQSGTPPSFHSTSADLVVMPVTVTDKTGRLISGLSRERFLVYDNGSLRDVALFSHEDTPVSVALVIDDSGSMRRKQGEVIAAATSFARLSNPDDEVVTFEFNDVVHDTLGGRRVTAADELALEHALSSVVPGGRTALYDAIVTGLRHLDHASATRKVLILLSDGGDNASRATLDHVLALARKSIVTIYAIGLIDPDEPGEVNAGALKTLAAMTGGERFLPESPGVLIQACRQIAREIRSSYTLGFEPRDHDGAYHHLRVEINGPDGRRMFVHTRPGYIAPGAERS